MINKSITLYVASLSLLLSTSCSDMLGTKVNNTFDDEVTWTLPEYAMGVLYNAYNNIPNTLSGFNSNYLDAASDNGCTNSFDSDIYRYSSGGMSVADNFLDNWETSYKMFQYINLFLEKGLGDNITYSLASEIEDQYLRQRSNGEAHFLRAWWGCELLTRFGGISESGEPLGYPIVLEYIDESDRDKYNNLARNTFQECVDQIVKDCDVAIDNLPLEYSDDNEGLAYALIEVGRANKKAAMALKSRVLLLAASPAYQVGGNGSDQAKWEATADAAYDCISAMSWQFTALLNSMMVGTSVQTAENDEFLFRKWFNNNTMEKYHFPPMFFGGANTCPSQNLVDAFPTNDGYPITDSRSCYDPQNPYANRDLRLSRYIYYNGATFNNTRAIQTYEGGLDAPGSRYNSSRTGYYVRKGLSEKKDMLYDKDDVSSTKSDYHHSPLLRRGEQYLILAEALNEIGGPYYDLNGYTAYSIVKDIREQANVGGTTYLSEQAALGKAAFRAIILNERRLELAFENFRFNDMRRCNMPLDVDIYRYEITKDSRGVVNYNYDKKILVEDRSALADEKFRYIPIPQDEMLKNPNMVQNKGW